MSQFESFTILPKKAYHTIDFFLLRIHISKLAQVSNVSHGPVITIITVFIIATAVIAADYDDDDDDDDHGIINTLFLLGFSRENRSRFWRYCSNG